MAVVKPGAAGARVVFEDFSTVDGVLAIVGLDGTARILAKTSEPTSYEPGSLYRGHTLAEVLTSDHDLLGSELLAQPEDPDFAAVAGCLAPITTMGIHTFLGTARTADKVAVAYGGATSNFDAAVFVPAIREIRGRRPCETAWSAAGCRCCVMSSPRPPTPDRSWSCSPRTGSNWRTTGSHRSGIGSPGSRTARRPGCATSTAIWLGRPMTLALKPPRSTAT